MTDWLLVQNVGVCGTGCTSKEDCDMGVAGTWYWTLLYLVLEPLKFT